MAHKVGTQHALGRQEGLHTLELRRKGTPHWLLHHWTVDLSRKTSVLHQTVKFAPKMSLRVCFRKILWGFLWDSFSLLFHLLNTDFFFLFIKLLHTVVCQVSISSPVQTCLCHLTSAWRWSLLRTVWHRISIPVSFVDFAVSLIGIMSVLEPEADVVEDVPVLSWVTGPSEPPETEAFHSSVGASLITCKLLFLSLFGWRRPGRCWVSHWVHAQFFLCDNHISNSTRSCTKLTFFLVYSHSGKLSIQSYSECCRFKTKKRFPFV